SPVLSGSRRPRSRESPQVSQLSRGARGPARSPGQARSRASIAAGPERRRLESCRDQPPRLLARRPTTLPGGGRVGTSSPARRPPRLANPRPLRGTCLPGAALRSPDPSRRCQRPVTVAVHSPFLGHGGEAGARGGRCVGATRLPPPPPPASPILADRRRRRGGGAKSRRGGRGRPPAPSSGGGRAL
ncbi:unnamed protein product, partial [Rangifer tarandus platyrhynchus]